MHPTSFEELSDKYDSRVHVLMVSGNEQKDKSAITKMLDSNVPSRYILPLMIVPNHNPRYQTYLSQLVMTFDLQDHEIYYIEEIQALYSETSEKNILTEGEDVYSLPHYFLTVLSLAIARTEAVGSEYLWVPWTKHDIQNISYQVNEYIDAINELANVGTLEGHFIDIKFPILNMDFQSRVDQPEPISVNDDEALIMFSGGLDCTVAAYIMKELGKGISLYNVQYGQSNRYQEQYSIKKIINDFRQHDNVPYDEITLSCISKIGGSALLRDDTKLQNDNSKLEYVPFRNTNLLNFGIIYALKNNIKFIVTGGHHDDTLSPDNRLPYFEVFQKVLNLQNCSKEIELYPVLLYLGGKSELVYVGSHLNINFKHCWSCLNYVDPKDVGAHYKACGSCGNCVTRYHAFRRVGLVDPIDYEVVPRAREQWYGWANGSEELLKKMNIRKIELTTSS